MVSIKEYTVQVKHIAHVQSFFWVSHTNQSGTAACVEVHAHFDTPTQCPPITARVIVTMIFNASELVPLTCVFTYIQSDYAAHSTSTCVHWTCVTL